MRPIQIHPLSALAGVGAFFLLGMMQSPTIQAKQPLGLTQEEKEILSHLSIVHLDDNQGGMAKTIRVEGVNVQIVNGLDATNGYPIDPETTDLGLVVTNGVGNLIIGYNEPGNPFFNDRTGSHNLVIGHGLSYDNWGGAVIGRDSAVRNGYATVIGGQRNRATSVYGMAVGGRNNWASGVESIVAGGLAGQTMADFTVCVGGAAGRATAQYAATFGGNTIKASGDGAVAIGGELNEASGHTSVVSGGKRNDATVIYSAVNGGEFNLATAQGSTVNGGEGNTASGLWSSISGGQANVASGNYSNVSGGDTRSVIDPHDWRAGSLFEDN